MRRSPSPSASLKGNREAVQAWVVRHLAESCQRGLSWRRKRRCAGQLDGRLFLLKGNFEGQESLVALRPVRSEASLNPSRLIYIMIILALLCRYSLAQTSYPRPHCGGPRAYWGKPSTRYFITAHSHS